MTRADISTTAFSLITAGVCAWFLVHCGREVELSHPMTALKLYAGAGAILVLAVVGSLWANNQRRAERCAAELGGRRDEVQGWLGELLSGRGD